MLILALALAANCQPTGQEIPVTSEAVGGVRSGSKISSETVAEAFPGYRVRGVEEQGPGGFPTGKRTWQVLDSAGRPMLFLGADARGEVVAISILSSVPRTREGLGVGSRVADLSASGALRCTLRPTEDEWEIACTGTDLPNVEFVFIPTDSEVTRLRGGKTGPPSVTEGRDREIKMIVWRPKARLDRE